ncbi:MAG: hypothetical protein AAGI54_04080 [Planctomycetota bacterium]
MLLLILGVLILLSGLLTIAGGVLGVIFGVLAMGGAAGVSTTPQPSSSDSVVFLFGAVGGPALLGGGVAIALAGLVQAGVGAAVLAFRDLVRNSWPTTSSLID